MKPFFIILLSVIFFSCSSDEEEVEIHELTKEEKLILKDFSKQLTSSIVDYKYEFLRNSWDEVLFKKKVQNLNQTQSIVMDYWFKELNMSLSFETHLVDVSNKIRYEGWRFIDVSNKFSKDHLIIQYTFGYNNALIFSHYYVELVDDKPRVTDIKNVKHDKWFSDVVENLIRLNSKYPPRSKAVREFNLLRMQSEKSLLEGDTLAALNYLYDVPSELSDALLLSDKKIEIASYLHDSIFYSVLFTELEGTKRFYYDYLMTYHSLDTLKMDEITSKINEQTGVNEEYLDSISSFKYFWVN